VTQEIDRRAIRPAARGVSIRRAMLGSSAGMIGAARAAWCAALPRVQAARGGGRTTSRAAG
jgi:hypothetical protein